MVATATLFCLEQLMDLKAVLSSQIRYCKVDNKQISELKNISSATEGCSDSFNSTK